MVATASIPAHPSLPPELVSRALEVLQNPHLSLHDAATSLGLTLEQLTLFLASLEADELLSLAHTAAATRTRFCVVGTLHKSVAALTKVLDECNAAPAPPTDAPPEAHTHRARQLAAACRASSLLLRLANLSVGGMRPRPMTLLHAPPPRAARSSPHPEPPLPLSRPSATSAEHPAAGASSASSSTAVPSEQAPARTAPTGTNPPRADQPPSLTQVIPTIRASAPNPQPPTARFLSPNASPAARMRATSGAPP